MTTDSVWTIEHFWMNPSTADEWKTGAQHQVVVSAPSALLRNGTHAFGHEALGHPPASIDHEEATGRFVAVDMDSRKLVVFTHQSPHPKFGPIREGTRKVGTFDRNALALVCVPTGPVTLKPGTGGLANNQITGTQQEIADKVCEEAGLPLPRVAGRPAGGRRWSDPAVLGTLRRLETPEHC